MLVESAKSWLIIPLLLAGGCQSVRVEPSQMGPSPTTVEGQVSGRTAFEMPSTIPGSSVRMVPFVMEERKGWFDRSDPYALSSQNSGLVASRWESTVPAAGPVPRPGDENDQSRQPVPFSLGGTVRWHNCIFKDLATGEEWPLLERRGVISRWYAFGSAHDRYSPYVCQALVFLVTTEDTDRDGALTNADACQAIFTDGQGRGAKVISPANCQVWNLTPDFPAAAVHLLVVADTNGDGRFDALDTPVPYIYRAGQSGSAERLIRQETQERVEKLLK